MVLGIRLDPDQASISARLERAADPSEVRHIQGKQDQCQSLWPSNSFQIRCENLLVRAGGYMANGYSSEDDPFFSEFFLSPTYLWQKFIDVFNVFLLPFDEEHFLLHSYLR
ncbi:hypothetical protein NE237_028855 [Protea cynaroides]|uniref:Uncharacterized protein n=1 Tax=Protea cynaroides TaxID=273540 RepID=A0A9Q0JVP2_9MAGN|nr:hypothetical protein NE237_028855 [Protea cynaroides]